MNNEIVFEDESLIEAINPTHSLRWLCRNCDVAYIIVDKGFAIEVSDKFRDCMRQNHCMILQILHNDKWVEMALPESCPYCGAIIRR